MNKIRIFIICFSFVFSQAGFAQNCKELLEICKAMELKFRKEKATRLIPLEEVQKKNRNEMTLMDCRREYKQFEAFVEKLDAQEEAEEAKQEVEEKNKLARKKLIFDVLDDNLLAKVCNEVIFCMEKHKYKLQEVEIGKRMDDLKKYSPNTPLNKMNDVYISNTVDLKFDKNVSVFVNFYYKEDWGDNKEIELRFDDRDFENKDFDKKLESFKTFQALNPLQKFRIIAKERRDYESQPDEKLHILTENFGDLDVNKIIFEANPNPIIDVKVLGKKPAYRWESAPKSTMLANEVVAEYIKKRYTDRNAVESSQNLLSIQNLRLEYDGKSVDYLYHNYIRKGKQANQEDYVSIQWEGGKEGKKTYVLLDGKAKHNVSYTMPNFEYTEFSKKVSMFQFYLPNISALDKLDIFQEDVFVEEFSGHQCFRLDTKWYEPLTDNTTGFKSQSLYFFDMNTFLLIGIRNLNKFSDSISGHESVYDGFKEFNGQWLPTKSIYYTLNDLMERKPSPSTTTYDYKFNVKVDESLFSTDFSKTYPRN